MGNTPVTDRRNGAARWARHRKSVADLDSRPLTATMAGQGVARVGADTATHNIASGRALEDTQFVRVAADGGLPHYECSIG